MLVSPTISPFAGTFDDTSGWRCHFLIEAADAAGIPYSQTKVKCLLIRVMTEVIAEMLLLFKTVARRERTHKSIVLK